MSLASVRRLSVRPYVNIFVSAQYCLEYFDDTSQLCRTDHDDMSRTNMRALPLLLFSYLPFDAFYAFVSALKLEYPLEYNHDTSQLCKTDHDDASHTGILTLACILSELFPLDSFSGNALYFEYR